MRKVVSMSVLLDLLQEEPWNWLLISSNKTPVLELLFIGQSFREQFRDYHLKRQMKMKERSQTVNAIGRGRNIEHNE